MISKKVRTKLTSENLFKKDHFSVDDDNDTFMLRVNEQLAGAIFFIYLT